MDNRDDARPRSPTDRATDSLVAYLAGNFGQFAGLTIPGEEGYDSTRHRAIVDEIVARLRRGSAGTREAAVREEACALLLDQADWRRLALRIGLPYREPGHGEDRGAAVRRGQTVRARIDALLRDSEEGEYLDTGEAITVLTAARAALAGLPAALPAEPVPPPADPPCPPTRPRYDFGGAATATTIRWLRASQDAHPGQALFGPRGYRADRHEQCVAGIVDCLTDSIAPDEPDQTCLLESLVLTLDITDWRQVAAALGVPYHGSKP